MRWLVALLLTVSLARADGEESGAFDYYVLSLSWSPTWCALEGDARDAEQCDAAHGWILHGLWPQYHRGYPAFCPTSAPPPARSETAGMADIMGSGGLAWHQWKKHGTCSGLAAGDYFRLARTAFGNVTRPEVFRKLQAPVTLPAALVEEAFIAENPGLEPDMLTVTCDAGRIEEVRICLSKGLAPVPCGSDVVKDCTLGSALLDPVR
ncbi:Ribonuclease T2 family protein [Citreicella sp. SE45]|uniref:Ribonuclease T2 n=1 Tax=Salipiger thiooxidans TaxID=282683 RepID=A0A1G7KE91_9RHOB|nr:ribonuclease T2 [Salipiger thiooxidans]EEX13917.1 Ribonuclease T2 family protein [Citreicella sp. SE45]NVK61687.1 ribonuclease T2 [Paracoccaceae bacterium]SDF35588.1 ribonuclease T2 [Salipiger thiooxidans]